MRKPRIQVERYVELLDRLKPQRIMEVGIYEGGSTAFMAQVGRPEKLIAVDIVDPRPGLEDFIAHQGFEASVATHWNVDQSDVVGLREVVRREIGDARLDLVVDDASHFLDPSRRTFEALFPLLRTGGEFVLEDWAWAHAQVNAWEDRVPMTQLVFELVIAAAHHPEIVAGLEIDRAWTVIRRGPAEIDPAQFDLRKLCGERGNELLAGVEGRGVKLPPEPGRFERILSRVSR